MENHDNTMTGIEHPLYTGWEHTKHFDALDLFSSVYNFDTPAWNYETSPLKPWHSDAVLHYRNINFEDYQSNWWFTEMDLNSWQWSSIGDDLEEM